MKSNNTYLNILASYAYIGNSKPFNQLFINASKSGMINAMVDSGAHTIHNAKSKKGLNLDGYCRYLDANAEYVEKYVMLDVIKNEKETKRNYETMISRGYNPMYVFTEFDNDFSYVADAVKNNRHLCVAGGVSTKSDWMKHRYKKVFKLTNALIHGLGFVAYPAMYQVPLHSVDSSSWIQSCQVYGNIPIFDDGLKTCAYKDLLTGKKKFPNKLIKVLEQGKITPKLFLDRNSHRGQNSIGTFVSIYSYIEYQKYSKTNNLNLFLAVANQNQLKQIMYIAEHYDKGSLTYDNFKKVLC